MGSGAKSYMKKGFLIYEEIRKFFPIYMLTFAKMTYPAMMAARLQVTHSGELAPTMATEW
jgi:hypothetical protein